MKSFSMAKVKHIEVRDYENSDRQVWERDYDDWWPPCPAFIFTDFHCLSGEDALIPCIVPSSVPQCYVCGEWAMKRWSLIS